jgi:hypothetical protein
MKTQEKKKPEPGSETPKNQAQFIASLRQARAGDGSAEICEWVPPLLDEYLSGRCGDKKNHLEHCDETEEAGCACGGSTGSGLAAMVDLIVLIDTSGSMGGSANAVSDAASAAIAQAKETCPTDLKVTYLGVDGTWTGTLFTTSHRTYLASAPPPLSTDNPVGGYDPEEGANAIEDLSKYTPWRKGACRAIFYISDEELDSISPLGDVANEAAATNAAIVAANSNKVTIFAHHLTYQNRGPAVIGNYNNLCNSTGGKAFFSATASKNEYVKLLSEVICSACGNKCKEAEIPDLKPCISIAWGESKCDCLETDDVEVLCITVCNCYSNIVFSDLSITYVFVTDASGNPVPTLPDGTPSVQIIPIGPFCFGDIPPCKDGKPGCVSRELVILTRGAKGGSYKIIVGGICYSVTNHYGFGECFLLDLCQD